MSGPRLPSSFEGEEQFYDESFSKMLWRRVKEEPLVPVGIGWTCWALWRAGAEMRRGNKVMTNRMFRQRIYGQGFTLLCLVAGSFYYKEEREKRKEMQGRLAEHKAMEKRDAWIRELEARDREDQDARARRDAARGTQTRTRESKLNAAPEPPVKHLGDDVTTEPSKKT